jgi:serine protease Do
MSTGEATSPASTTPIAAPAWPGYADLIDRVMPAVVSVTVTRKAATETIATPEGFGGPQGGPDNEMFERFMERFFNDRGREQFRMPQMPQDPRGMPMAAAGTGFVFDAEGYIATNNHVVADADEVTVTFHDGREIAATVVGSDPDTDLAVLKIEADEPLPFVEFADSDSVRVGDAVVAIGNRRNWRRRWACRARRLPTALQKFSAIRRCDISPNCGCRARRVHWPSRTIP